MRSLALTLVLAVGLAACGASSVESTTTLTLAEPTPVATEAVTTEPLPALDWAVCVDAECATLTVPLDHDDPSAGTIDLEVTRLRAEEPDRRIGVLFFNPGGPGAPGVPLWQGAFSNDLLRRFDVVSWNTRGVSAGNEIVCVQDPAFFRDLDPTPDTPKETQAIEQRTAEFVDGCLSGSAHMLPHVSTVSTAKDMDLIREALGEEQISYLGLSYGSALGSVYATLFPTRVRAMVLDGAFILGSDDLTSERNLVAEGLLTAALDDCAANKHCAFNHDGDPYSAFDELVTALDEAPIAANGGQIGILGLIDALDWGLRETDGWQPLMRALAAAEDGDGGSLADLAGFADSVFTNQAGVAVSCLDWGTPDPATVQLNYDSIEARIPHLAPIVAPGPFDGCPLPIKPDPPPRIDARGAGPILVIGATGDFPTPLATSRALADQLDDATLLIVEAIGHTSYRPGRFDTRCVTNVVDGYLIDLELPAHESICVHGDPVLHAPGQ